MKDSHSLKASELHEAARESLDAALAKYGFKPAGGYTEGSKASHLYRGDDRFLSFRLVEGKPPEGEVELGLAADGEPISADHSMTLEELAEVKGGPAPSFDLYSAADFAASALEQLESFASEFLSGDVRSFVHEHAEVMRRRGGEPNRGNSTVWPSPSLVTEGIL